MRSVANMPGPGGSLGMCAVCGETFLAEIILGKRVQLVEVKGFDKDVCVHDKCMDVLKRNGPEWRNLPEGPLRRAYAKAADEQQERIASETP